MKERKDLIDDALHATRAAAEEGIIPGGGVVFLRAIEAVENAKKQAKNDEKIGFDILAGNAASTVPAQIADNAGEDGEIVVMRRFWRTRIPATATTPLPASTAICSRWALSTRQRSPRRPC